MIQNFNKKTTNYNKLLFLTVNNLIDLRMHIGHLPKTLKMNLISIIYGFREDITIFNIHKIIIGLRLVLRALIQLVRQRGQFFLLGSPSHIPIVDLFKYFFKKYNFSNKQETNLYISGYIGQKWVGGLFSNWKGTLLFLDYIKQSPKQHKKRYQKYLVSLESFDYTNMKFLPDLVFTFNGKSEALEEISHLNIPIIGLNDSNIEPNLFLYQIFSNDDSFEIIQFFCNFIELVILKGKQLDQKRFFMFCFNTIKKKLYYDSL